MTRRRGKRNVKSSKTSISRWTNISAVAPTSVAPSSTPRRTKWAWTVATFFGTGLLKPGPGTWASAATVLLHAALSGRRPEYSPYIAGAICVAATAIGIPAATIVARESGRKDPGHVVIDETAGQALTLVVAPFTWQYLTLSFILFRAFDILKPPPVRSLERLPEGTGIVVDDLGAGAYAAILVLLVRHWHLL